MLTVGGLLAIWRDCLNVTTTTPDFVPGVDSKTVYWTQVDTALIGNVHRDILNGCGADNYQQGADRDELIGRVWYRTLLHHDLSLS